MTIRPILPNPLMAILGISLTLDLSHCCPLSDLPLSFSFSLSLLFSFSLFRPLDAPFPLVLHGFVLQNMKIKCEHKNNFGLRNTTWNISIAFTLVKVRLLRNKLKFYLYKVGNLMHLTNEVVFVKTLKQFVCSLSKSGYYTNKNTGFSQFT